MPNNEHQNPTYEELAELWGCDKADLKKARESLAAQMIEGEHFTRDSATGGALRFSPAGQVILADELGFSLECDVPAPEFISESPGFEMADELGRTMAEEAAPRAAIAFFKHLPAAVAAQVRRMVSDPTPEEMPLVYGSMQLAFGAATDPKPLLTQSQEVN